MQPVYPGVASKGLASTQNTGFLTPNGDICRLLQVFCACKPLSWANSVAILSSIHDKKDIFLSSINDKNIYLLQQDSVSIVKKHYKRQEYSHSLIHLLVDWHIWSSQPKVRIRIFSEMVLACPCNLTTLQHYIITLLRFQMDAWLGSKKQYI